LNLRSQDPSLEEPNTRFSVGDSSVVQILVARRRPRYPEAVRVRPNEGGWEAGPALVELADSWCGEPMWLLGAVMPGYRTAARIGERGVSSVAFLRAGSTSPEEVIARANAIAAWGSLSAASSDPWQREVLERAFDELNPTLAILASYALDRAGRHDLVRNLLDRLLTAGEYIPFDVALVARFGHLTEHEQIVPGYPLMTRGWAFLDEVAPLRELATRVRGLLAPSQWATGLNLPREVIAMLLAVGASGGPMSTPPNVTGSASHRGGPGWREKVINLLPGRADAKGRPDAPEVGPVVGA
jgi:hypothetical protein